MRPALPTPLLAAVVLAAALPSSASAACGGADVALSGLDRAAARSALLCTVNAQRAARGLSAYRDSAGLSQAAQGHSDAMVSQSFFDHVSPDGGTLVARVRATGWIPSAGSYALGEAIAWAGTPLDTATQVVTGWLNSPPHRAILLDDRFREAGLGVTGGIPTGPDLGTTIVLDAGMRTGAARSTSSSPSGPPASATTPPTASKVRQWRSGKTCAKAARRSRAARARCASTSTRSKRSSRARPLSSTRSATTWKARLMTSRPTS
ncbi:MAG: CAP domain-containing protein [Solirubrobacteraceae bacterium]